MDTKSVFHIFGNIERTKHKIIKKSHEDSLKSIWDVMQENGLKMVAVESIPDPENKIPGFIQGFITFNDLLEFFVNNFDGNVTPFERTLKEIDLFYSMSNRDDENNNIRVVHKDEKL